jgi:flagellar biosynthesis/type III secretory pathway M-ring protein FliF/YscJ
MSCFDAAAVVGGVVGGVGGLLLLLLLVLLAILFLLLARRKKKEQKLRLAEQWSDEETETEMDEFSGSESSVLHSSAAGAAIRRLSITDLETSNISFEPQVSRPAPAPTIARVPRILV